MSYQKLLEYIDNHWENLIVESRVDTPTHMALPHAFVAPSVEEVDGFVFREQFYWDTLFIAEGLKDSDHRKQIVNMTNNLMFMFKRLGYIPNSSNIKWHSGRSQPPVLSSLVRLVYSYNHDDIWLENSYELLIDEYRTVWIGKFHPHNRLKFNGLSRYYNASKEHQGAEDESGWDYTTRFDSRCLDWIPIDLNSLLYKYEKDLQCIASQLGLEHEAEQWGSAARLRQLKINKYMWHYDDGFYYDYNFVEQSIGKNKTLAAYMPMFVGLANEEQARLLVDALSFFETPHGITTTQLGDNPSHGQQWSSPNGWAPLHYIVVEGLKKYGYFEDARRIAEKWTNTVNHLFTETGVIFEKYNVVNVDEDVHPASYPDQHGFAWTNAVTRRFIKDFSLK